MESPATPYLRIMLLVLNTLMCFEPVMPQYKKLKNGEIVSLSPKIMDQNNITDGLETTVVLHIQ